MNIEWRYMKSLLGKIRPLSDGQRGLSSMYEGQRGLLIIRVSIECRYMGAFWTKSDCV